MNITALWSELLRRNRLLAIAGLGYVLLFSVLAVIAAFDAMTILGINRWIKPMKFAISIAVFQWTMAWLLAYLNTKPQAVRLITWGIIITMLAEIMPIVGQAARGTTSHFNVTTPFDGAIFSLMGVMILINTLLIVYALMLFFTTPVNLPAAYLWGIRLGLIIFVLASIEGGLMAAMLHHSIGVADGGAGLPFVNWSTRGGDLRIAHFVGLHALQVLPFVGFLLDRFGKQLSAIRPVTLTIGFAAVYALLTACLFIQAMAGRPLLALS